MTDHITIPDLYDCKVAYLADLFSSCRYPWELLPKIGAFADALLKRGIPGFREIRPGVLAGDHVKIAESAVIEGIAVLGDGTELRPGAYLRGNVLTGRECVIGNSSELKNCILLDHTMLPHYNYVGDSILGNHAHLGAGAVCSNLKSDGKNVVIHGVADYETGLRKCGAMIADGADVGCGSVLNPGSVLGKNVSVYPLTPVRGVIPAAYIMKAQGNCVPRT